MSRLFDKNSRYLGFSIQLKRFVVALLVSQVVGCVSLTDGEERSRPPEITATIGTDDAVQAAIEHGEPTLSRVVKLVSDRKDWERVTGFLSVILTEGSTKLQIKELANAAKIFVQSPIAGGDDVFTSMVGSGRANVRMIAWLIATELPSDKVAVAIENEISRALKDSDEKLILVPQMAKAVKANKIKTVYTVLRLGLMETGDEAFANAMISVSPRKASRDILEYLALIPVEELRQINFSNLSFFTAMTSLEHFKKFPPAPSHAKIHHLYYYAVSRNIAISELAHKVITTYLPAHKELMAKRLSDLPEWIQIAYVESVRRNMSASVGTLLRELDETTSRRAVREEIKAALRL